MLSSIEEKQMLYESLHEVEMYAFCIGFLKFHFLEYTLFGCLTVRYEKSGQLYVFFVKST